MGRNWGGGCIYDYKENVFTEKNQEYQLSADMIVYREEDKCKCSGWGLIGLGTAFVPMDENLATVRIYTAQQTVCRITFHNISLLAGRKSYSLEEISYNSFFLHLWRQWSCALSDYGYKIFNRFCGIGTGGQRTDFFMPCLRGKVRSPYGYNNFSIEFASLTYKNPGFKSVCLSACKF